MPRTLDTAELRAKRVRRRQPLPRTVQRIQKSKPESRLGDALIAIRQEQAAAAAAVPVAVRKAALLKGVADVIEQLIDVLDRYGGDPELEAEEDVGADDFGEPEEA